jgi:signal transduction histidine kinase
MVAEVEQTQETQLDHNRELTAVNELAEALTLGQGVDAVVETALNSVINLMGADVGSIHLIEKEGGTLKLKASQGFLSPELIKAITNTVQSESPMRGLLETGHAFAIEDIRTALEISRELARLLTCEGFVSWACAPLKMEGEVIGVYHLGKRGKRSFSSHDLALLEVIGNVVGSSISNAQLLKDLRRKENELRRALRRAVELQEDERKRLARELHDEVGQALTSILIRLKALQEEDVQAQNERLDDLRTLTAQTIEELRRLAMDLRPAALDSLGIVPALEWYTQQCADRAGLDIQFIGPDSHERLPQEIELILYRIAQEGITNAMRHGKAQKIVVSLEREPHSWRLVIKDNGRGFNTAALDQGLGLVGIRERVELLNGDYDIQSAPGTGTQLCIEIPVKR